MEWDRDAVRSLHELFRKKHMEMKAKHRTDRRNFSAIWNRYLEVYGAVLLSDNSRGKSGPSRSSVLIANSLLVNLINMVNFDNERVAGGLLVDNPDRPGQYIVLQREIAERIMVLGML